MLRSGKLIIEKTLEILQVYWELVRIIAPIAIGTQFLVETGVIAGLAPYLEPVMGLYGLPPELAFAWLTGLLIGTWGAVVVIFTLVPVAEFTTADMTVFAALLLFAHALPIEQRIIQKAGPGFLITSLLRLLGGMIYAMILHLTFEAFGLFSEVVNPAWIPTADSDGWAGFLLNLVETLAWMLIVLLVLAWLMEFLKWSGIMEYLKKGISPIFKYAGIHSDASDLVAIGLLLGISFGGGLLIREARKGLLPPRQVFLACVFMGFAHSVIEDTIVVVALGADLTSVLVGRVVFAIVATGLIALLLNLISDRKFHAMAFRSQS